MIQLVRASVFYLQVYPAPVSTRRFTFGRYRFTCRSAFSVVRDRRRGFLSWRAGRRRGKTAANRRYFPEKNLYPPTPRGRSTLRPGGSPARAGHPRCSSPGTRGPCRVRRVSRRRRSRALRSAQRSGPRRGSRACSMLSLREIVFGRSGGEGRRSAADGPVRGKGRHVPGLDTRLSTHLASDKGTGGRSAPDRLGRHRFRGGILSG